MHKLKLVIYYLLVQYLPHSRLWAGFNRIRRWYLCTVLKVAPRHSESKFEPCIYISDGRHLNIGKHVRINEHVFLQGPITIGDYTMLAPGVAIYTRTHDHSRTDLPMVTQGDTETMEVVLEEDVWLGRNVVVLPGVQIGKGAIVGANAVVTRDIPAFTVWGGVPAKQIRSRLDP